jgi:ribosome-associated protein
VRTTKAKVKDEKLDGAASAALLALVLHSLDEDKAEEIVTIDLRGKTAIADNMVIANGRSQRQVSAMADHLMERVLAAGFKRCRVEGKRQADWVLIDCGDVVVHLFRPEVRTFYNLEKMWSAEFGPATQAAVAAEPDSAAGVETPPAV